MTKIHKKVLYAYYALPQSWSKEHGDAPKEITKEGETSPLPVLCSQNLCKSITDAQNTLVYLWLHCLLFNSGLMALKPIS